MLLMADTAIKPGYRLHEFVRTVCEDSVRLLVIRGGRPNYVHAYNDRLSPIPITGEILRDWFGAKPKFSTKFGLLMNIPSDEGSGLNYVESGETGVTFNVGDIGPFHADHVHEFQFALAFFGLPHEVAPAFLEGSTP